MPGWFVRTRREPDGSLTPTSNCLQAVVGLAIVGGALYGLGALIDALL